MSSRKEQIIAALASSLAATAGIGTVYRSRVEAFSRDEAPAMVIEPGPARCNPYSTCKLDWTLDVIVAIHTRGNIPDQQADPIQVSAHSLIMADRTIGGLAIDIIPSGDDPQRDKADLTSLWLVTTYQVRFRTLATDLESD